MRRQFRWQYVGIIAIALSFFAQNVQADGVYRRFDGTSSITVNGGASLASADESDLLLKLGAEWRFIDAAGPIFVYESDFDTHLFSFGVTLRPLFPALFLKDMQQSKSWLNRLIESVAIRLFAGFNDDLDALFRVGLAVDFPLLAHSNDLSIRTSFDYLNVNGQGEWIGGLSLAFNFSFSDHIATSEPMRFRP